MAGMSSSRKHHFDIHSTCISGHYCLKSAISFSVLLAFSFLVLFLWYPPTRTNISSRIHSHYNHKPPKLKLCKENFSVYIYDLPTKFNLGLLGDCLNLNIHRNMCPHVANQGLGQPFSGWPGLGWYATNQFTSEMLFHARLENHRCRTLDPEAATLFYVPFYGGLHASSKVREANLSERDALAVELAEYVVRQPWWRRRGGGDHFLVLGRTAWDFLRKRDGGQETGATCLLNLPAVQNMSVLTVERNPWQGSNQHGIPYPSYFHPSTSDEMLTWQKLIARANRPHLFSFVGAPRTGIQKAAVRDEIIRQCAESSQCNLLKCGNGNCDDPRRVLGVMTASRFCLQAPGDSFTRRSTFDSMVAGCVPVFFSPHTAYSQYSWYFPGDPSAYSVFIDYEVKRNGSEKRVDIEEELRKIPEERVERMRKTVIGLIPRVSYLHPNSTDNEMSDAIDVAIRALSKQQAEAEEA